MVGSLDNRVIRTGDPRAGLDPELWPLIGSSYAHEDFINMLVDESAQTERKDHGNAENST